MQTQQISTVKKVQNIKYKKKLKIVNQLEQINIDLLELENYMQKNSAVKVYHDLDQLQHFRKAILHNIDFIIHL